MSRTSVATLSMYTYTHSRSNEVRFPNPAMQLRIRERERDIDTTLFIKRMTRNKRKNGFERGKEIKRGKERKGKELGEWKRIAGNGKIAWIMQCTWLSELMYFEQHPMLDTCMQGPKGWLKPLLLRRIMTTKLLHVISLNEQSTRYNTLA